MKVKLALLAAFLSSSAIPEVWAASPTETSAPSPFKRRLSLGLGYTGALIRYRIKSRWSLEGHYLVGKTSSDDGDVSSRAIGLRALRHFHPERNLQWYVGADASFLSAESDHFKSSSGFGAGGFGGLEHYVLPRLSITLDAGPYYIQITQRSGGDSDSGIDFVLHTSLNFHLF